MGLLAPLTYTVQLYNSTVPDDVFSPIVGATVTFVIPTSISVGDIFFSTTTGLSIPVSTDERLLLVASASGGGLVVGGTVVGFLSAGLNIV